MNLLLLGIEPERLADVDALSKNNVAFDDEATIVLTNPPFKGSLDADHVMPDLIRTVSTEKTELLFLALILSGLRTGGRLSSCPMGYYSGAAKRTSSSDVEIIRIGWIGIWITPEDVIDNNALAGTIGSGKQG